MAVATTTPRQRSWASAGSTFPASTSTASAPRWPVNPPRTFGRRILLERAAYRMITTTAPLIDIAVEAGYGSQEAFTRVFTKAYVVAPATWRRKPGHLQIEAPSDVHFHPDH